jgi:hypothetical protein
MRRGRMAAALIAMVLASAGCAALPAQLVCKGVEQVTCQRMAAEIIARKNAEDPKHRVVRIVITDARGSFELTRDDGSGEATIID